ncbi:MAG: DUF4174 domain-containing protein [Pseudomonadota bacterium]
MKRLLAPLALLGAALAWPSSVGMAQTSNPLSDLQWKKRVVLLFAKSRSDAGLDKQVDLLREVRPDVSDRDMIVLRTAGREETRPVMGYTALRNGTGRQLRARYKPAERGLTVILLGKDGGEKKRWTKVVRPEEIFQVIDAMPMRQREMRDQDS